jgi:hypothetical protein
MAAPGTTATWRLLRSRATAGAATLARLAPLRRREPEPLPRHPRSAAERDGEGDRYDELLVRLWELYALSRVSDALLADACRADGGEAGSAGGRRLARGALALHGRFLGAIGLERVEHRDAFSAFHHEIFEVVPDEAAGAVVLEDVLWPGFRFGDLLVCRAGVRVRAPSALVDPEVATTSTLYFAHVHGTRRTSDLSHGWGSNSQWRTRLHRFYDDAEGLHCNWDGTVDLGTYPAPPADERGSGGNPDLPMERRVELLLHRCFVRAPAPEPEWDWFPFADRLSLRTAAWPLDGATAIVRPGDAR